MFKQTLEPALKTQKLDYGHLVTDSWYFLR